MTPASMRRPPRTVFRCPAEQPGVPVLAPAPVSASCRFWRMFSRVMSLRWFPASTSRGTWTLASSVMSPSTRGNPLWGGSPENHGSSVNLLMGPAARRSPCDVIDVYKGSSLGAGDSGGRVRS